MATQINSTQAASKQVIQGIVLDQDSSSEEKCSEIFLKTLSLILVCSVNQSESQGKFDVIKRLGYAASKPIYLAKNRQTNEVTVLKEYKKKAKSQALREFYFLSKYPHPHIIRTFNLYKDKHHTHYLQLEWIKKGDLASRLSKGPIKEEREIRLYFQQILNALTYFHANGFAYRGIKPANILISDDNRALLADFEFAIDIGSKGIHPLSQLYNKGTRLYRSPEQLLKRSYNCGVDHWAAGILLFEMAYGRVPFNSDSKTMREYQILNERVQFPASPARSELFKDLVRNLLIKNPKERLGANRSCLAIAHHPWVTGQ